MAEARTCRRKELMERVQGERSVITTQVLRRLGLRTRATWPDAAGSTERSVRHARRPSLTGGTGMVSDVGFEQRYPPPDHMVAPDHGGRCSLHEAVLPRWLAAGEAQEGPCHSAPPPLHPPAAPHQRQQPPGRWIGPAHLAGVTAGTSDAITTSIAAMPLFKRPSERPNMGPSSSPSAFNRETAAASRYGGTGGGDGAGAGGDGRVFDYRDRRRASPTQSQWSSYPGGEPSVGGHTPWLAGSRTRDHRSLGDAGGSGAQVDAEGDRRGVPPPGRLMRTPEECSLQQYPLMPSPTRAKRMRHLAGGDGVAGVDEHPALAAVGPSRGYHHGAAPWAAAPPPLSASGGGRYRRTGSLPSMLAPPRQGTGYGGAALLPPTAEREAVVVDDPLPSHDLHGPYRPTHIAAESAAAMTGLSLSASCSLGSGGRGVGGAIASQVGGGLASLGLGRGPWSTAGDRSGGGGGAHTGFRYGREWYQVDGQHRSSPLRDQHHHHPHQPPQPQDHQQHDLRSQRRSTFPAAGTTVAPPRLGRGVSDPGALAALLASRVSDSARPLYPLPGLAEAVTTVEGRSAGRGMSIMCGESVVGSAGDDGGAVRGDVAAAADADTVAGEGCTEQRWQSDITPTRPSVSAGCVEAGCDRRPRFAVKGSKKPAYCAKHRTAGMVDTRHPQCHDKQCARQPSFGVEGDRRASYCAGHKKPGMINVLARRCQQTGCFRHPNFGFAGDRRSSCCKQHREPGMVDIVSRRCGARSCTRRRLHNLKGLRPVSCSRHKLPGMIDVVSTRCQAPGCLSHPSFGYASDMKARRCAKHRLENMKGVKGQRQKLPREANRAAVPSSPSSSSPSPARSSPFASTVEDTGAGLACDGSGGVTRPSAHGMSPPRSPSGKTGGLSGAVNASAASIMSGAGGKFGGGGGPALPLPSKK